MYEVHYYCITMLGQQQHQTPNMEQRRQGLDSASISRADAIATDAILHAAALSKAHVDAE